MRALQAAKKPWNTIDLKGKMEGDLLYCTALPKSILTFSVYRPDLLVLPVIKKKIKESNKILMLFSPMELRKEGFYNASGWFQQTENVWRQLRTNNNAGTTAGAYLDWQHKLIFQDLNSPYLVLYNFRGKGQNAAVLERKNFDLEFIAEEASFVFYTAVREEAYYLCAVLNSGIISDLVNKASENSFKKTFYLQKYISGIFFPLYKKENKIQNELAMMSETAHKQVKFYLEKIDKQLLNLPTELREAIRMHVNNELKEINTLIKKLVD